MPQLVEISDSAVDNILANKELAKKVGCLADTVTMTMCGVCKRKKRMVRSVDYSKAKRCLSNAKGEALSTLKTTLNAVKLRVKYRSGRSIIVKTF